MDLLSLIDWTTVRIGVCYFFLLLGVFDVLVGMIGLIRLPDVYNRLHATTKIATTGAFFVLLSILIYDGFTAFGLKAVTVGIFLLMTAPVAGHVISRAAYHINIPPCDQTLFDSYCGKRQGDYCDDFDFHEGSYVYVNLDKRKDGDQADHFEEHLGGQFSEELSGLVQEVTPVSALTSTSASISDSEDEDEKDTKDDEELITGSESVEKSASVFDQFELKEEVLKKENHFEEKTTVADKTSVEETVSENEKTSENEKVSENENISENEKVSENEKTSENEKVSKSEKTSENQGDLKQ